MSTVARRHSGTDLAKYEPTKARQTQALRDARIELAARLGNVEALEREIDKKLDDQEDAVTWWRATVKRRGGDQKSNSRQIKVAESATLFAEEAERILGFDKQTISKWAKRLSTRDEYREAISRAARKKLQLEAEDNHRAKGTGENEWWTPAEYIETARSVLGAIDLDPATTTKANEVVKAAQIFTKRDNGLVHPWTGRVWLNPPYAQPLIGQFIDKLCAELEAGNVSAAVLLTHNYTDTEWFHRAERDAALLCFTRGRIGFLSPAGERAAPTQGQTFFYFGPDPESFRGQFCQYGFIR